MLSLLIRGSRACTSYRVVCMELHLYSTHDRRVETAWLRPQVSHQAPRPLLRTCAALRSHLLPPPGQSAGGKKKVNVYKGSFFYLVLRHWHARNLSSSMPPRRCRWSSARLYCGAVLWLGQYSGLQQCSLQWCQRRGWSLLCMWWLDSGLQ